MSGEVLWVECWCGVVDLYKATGTMIREEYTGLCFFMLLPIGHGGSQLSVKEEVTVQWIPPALSNGNLVCCNSCKGSIPSIIN